MSVSYHILETFLLNVQARGPLDSRHSHLEHDELHLLQVILPENFSNVFERLKKSTIQVPISAVSTERNFFQMRWKSNKDNS